MVEQPQLIEVLPPGPPMSRDEAQVLHESIECDIGNARRKLKQMHDDQGYASLGYGSFKAYLRGHFTQDVRHLYREYDAAVIEEQITEGSGQLATPPLPEGQLRPLKSLPTAEERREAWQVAQKASNGKPTARVVQAAVEAVKERSRPEMTEKPSIAGRGQSLQMVETHKAASTATFNQTNEKVDWALWTWNPVTGCLHDCPYCYARDIANRFYPQGFVPTFHEDRLAAPRNTKLPPESHPQHPKSRRVFACSMADLFGKWVPQEWIDAVLTEVIDNPQWEFLFLTKFPQRLAEIEWPANAWVGTTVDRQYRVEIAEKAFRGVKAGVKWLSCEPMLEPLKFSSLEMFDWVVIGGASRSSQTEESWPDFEWVVDLYQQARAAGCKVWFKPNAFSSRSPSPKELPR